MTKSKELAKNTFILFVGTFFTKIVQFLLLPIYTGYLSSAEYGTIELFNILIYLLIPILGLQIEQGIFRFLINNRKNEGKKKELISSAFFFTIITNFIYFIIFLLFSPLITYEYKWLLCLNLFIYSILSVFLQISRGLGNNKTYSFSSFIIAVFTIIFNIIFLVGLKLKVDGIIYGSLVGYIIGIIYIFIRLKIYKYISIKCVNKKDIIEMIKYSVPLIPNTLSWWILSFSDRIIVSIFLGLSFTGLLSIAYKFSNIIIFLFTKFNMGLTETIALHINDDDIEEYFNKMYNSVSNFLVSVSTIIITCMPFIFILLINKSYNDSYNLIPIAIIATIFQILATMFGTIYIAKKNTKSVAFTSIISAIINIVFDILLIKKIGMYAPIVSTLISFLFLFIYRYIDINKRYIKVRISNKLLINIFMVIIVILPLCYIDNIYIKLLNILISIIMSILLNYSNISFIKNKIISILKKEKQ